MEDKTEARGEVEGWGCGGAFNVFVVAVVVTGRSSSCAVDETVETVVLSGAVSGEGCCCRGDESGSGTSTGVTPDMTTTLNDISAQSWWTGGVCLVGGRLGR